MAHADGYGYDVGERASFLGIASNLLLFAVKISAGIIGRSQAMIADAFHTASDCLTSVGVLIGFRIASKPPDRHHPFGHARAESIAAKLVSIVLILVGVKVAFDSARVLVSGDLGEPGGIALAAAILSIVVKECTYRYVIHAGESIHSTSLRSDAYHHKSDVLSSVAALTGIAGAKLGVTFMDPLAGIIVAGFIIRMGAIAFHEAYDELMNAAPPEKLRRRLEHLAARVSGVREIKKIMVRKEGIELSVEIVIGVDGKITVREGHVVTEEIKKELLEKMPNVRSVIVHVEPVGYTDETEGV